MRAIPREFQERLDGGGTTLCRCWKLKRQDGAEMGFTDHDEDLFFGDVHFRAATGLNAGAMETGTGLSVDNAQAVGVLSDGGITEEDIRAGRYDRAEIEQWLVDWQRPELRVRLFDGSIGAIERSEAGFEAELRGATEELNVPIGRSILRTCDRVLGDSGCGVDLSVPAYSAEAWGRQGTEADRIAAEGLDRFGTGWFANGTLRWLSGSNQGLTFRIKRDNVEAGTRIIELWEAPSNPVLSGDRYRIVAGCDKHPDTCRNKFSNFLNFRGFPHIPGEDWVVVYPKEGQVNDGGSRGR